MGWLASFVGSAAVAVLRVFLAATGRFAGAVRADDVAAGIADWQYRQRHFTEWVQRVAYWYGQLALLPPSLRLATFNAIGRSETLQAATLFVAARRDPTAPEAWHRPEEVQIPIPIFH